ncbi:hypothetical protein FZW96_12055 [Bacillus sp. BGMRC 2118]|nr:hypothetical protein FZW96_12055 [Bacillus sp. BGMRC 2118]
MRNHAERILTAHITPLIKVSKERRGNSIRDKVHARNTKWSRAEFSNLQITIKAKGGAANRKGSFGYLVFPDDGRGSQNPVAQRFMKRGAEAATPILVEQIQSDLVKKIKEEL